MLGNELIEACKDGDLAKVKELIKRGADVNTQKGIALSWAIYKGHTHIVSYLLEQGALINDNLDLYTSWAGNNGYSTISNMLHTHSRQKQLLQSRISKLNIIT